MDWKDPSIIAASLSAVAAIAAAVATWRAPIAAAKIAENLRRSGDAAQDLRRFKLNVFTTIMQERAEIYSSDSVRALNSIDVAFSKSPAVREAWAELYHALNTAPIAPNHVLEERVRKLLKEMAFDLGIADTLRMDDFSRIYLPTALAQEKQIQSLQRQETLNRLTGQGVPPASNVDPAAKSAWPPAPTATKTP